MTQWEYRVERIGAPPMENDVGLFEDLDESIRKEIEAVGLPSEPADPGTPGHPKFGPNGWEMVSTFSQDGSIVWIFRRPVG